VQALSSAGYGPKVGAGRLVDLLERERVRAAFYTAFCPLTSLTL
jgi:hypothetical protein